MFQGLLHRNSPCGIDLNQLPEQIQAICIEVLEMAIKIDLLLYNAFVPWTVGKWVWSLGDCWHPAKSVRSACRAAGRSWRFGRFLSHPWKAVSSQPSRGIRNLLTMSLHPERIVFGPAALREHDTWAKLFGFLGEI